MSETPIFPTRQRDSEGDPVSARRAEDSPFAAYISRNVKRKDVY